MCTQGMPSASHSHGYCATLPLPPAPAQPYLQAHERGGGRRVLHVLVLLNQLLQVILQPPAGRRRDQGNIRVQGTLGEGQWPWGPASAAKQPCRTAPGSCIRHRRPCETPQSPAEQHRHSCQLTATILQLTATRGPPRAAAAGTAAQTRGRLLRGRPWRRPAATAVAAGWRCGGGGEWELASGSVDQRQAPEATAIRSTYLPHRHSHKGVQARRLMASDLVVPP